MARSLLPVYKHQIHKQTTTIFTVIRLFLPHGIQTPGIVKYCSVPKLCAQDKYTLRGPIEVFHSQTTTWTNSSKQSRTLRRRWMVSKLAGNFDAAWRHDGEPRREEWGSAGRCVFFTTNRPVRTQVLMLSKRRHLSPKTCWWSREQQTEQ